MKILVTGGTGFIGSYFIPILINMGYEIRLLVRDKIKAENLFGDKCEYFVGDVVDKESIEGCCEGIDIVFHLVAKSGNELPNKENFDIYRKINVEGTKNIISQCDNIKKFIYVSSTAAMGIVKDNPINENSPCDPYLPYQVTKYEAEELIKYKCQNGFPGIIVRPTKVYGINEANYSYLTLAKLVKKGIYFKIGKKVNYTSNVYVTDFVNALVNLITRGQIGETYIITSNESIGFIKTGEIIADVLGKNIKIIKVPEKFMIFSANIEEKFMLLLKKKPIVTKRNIEMTINDRVYDISKAKEELEYNPKVSMEEGIRKVITWYLEKGLL